MKMASADYRIELSRAAKDTLFVLVNVLKNDFEEIKLEVENVLKYRYCYNRPVHPMDAIIDRLQKTTETYEIYHSALKRKKRFLTPSALETIQRAFNDLKRAKKLKLYTWHLILLEQHLDGAIKASTQSVYFDAAQDLSEFKQLYELINSGEMKDVMVMFGFQRKFSVIKEDVVSNLEKIWHQQIFISDFVNRRNKASLTINIIKKVSSGELLRCLRLLDCLKPVLKQFGETFLKTVCETVTMNSVEIVPGENASSLTFTIIKEQEPKVFEVLDKLKHVFTFLYEKFFSATLAKDEGNKSSVMMQFGMLIGDDLCSLIIEKCLKPAVPKNDKKLDAFHKKILAAENFCSTLEDLCFLTRSRNKLLDFIYKVETLPANQMTEDFLSRAQSLLKESAYETVTVGELRSSVLESENSHDSGEIVGAQSSQSESRFSFAQCQISAYAKNLTKLFSDVKEAKKANSFPLSRVYFTTMTICRLYCSVVSTFQKDEIADIPKQAALAHNDCMYVAHYLCVLGYHDSLEAHSGVHVMFEDLSHKIRKLGVEAFLNQMKRQKQEILELLQELRDEQSKTDEAVILAKLERSVSRCLHRLMFLKMAWCDVLAAENYFKAMGTLFNTFLEGMMSPTLSMELISPEAAVEMDFNFTAITKQGADLFKTSHVDKSNFAHRYVRSWQKMQELQYILKADLGGIVNRWDVGKGPMAMHLTSNEVTHLIKALFPEDLKRSIGLGLIR